MAEGTGWVQLHTHEEEEEVRHTLVRSLEEEEGQRRRVRRAAGSMLRVG